MKLARYIAVLCLAAIGLGYSSGNMQFTVLCYSNEAATAPADTAENTLATCTVPANAMGANGTLRIDHAWTFTNGADDKIPRVRFSAIGGTAFYEATHTTIASASTTTRISNRNSATAQIGGFVAASSVGYGTSAVAHLTATVDTTVATTIVFTCQKETGANTCTLERYLVELITP